MFSVSEVHNVSVFSVIELVWVDAEMIGKNVVSLLCKIIYYTEKTELFLGQKVIHRKLFKKRKERNSVADSRDMATRRS